LAGIAESYVKSTKDILSAEQIKTNTQPCGKTDRSAKFVCAKANWQAVKIDRNGTAITYRHVKGTATLLV